MKASPLLVAAALTSLAACGPPRRATYTRQQPRTQSQATHAQGQASHAQSQATHAQGQTTVDGPSRPATPAQSGPTPATTQTATAEAADIAALRPRAELPSGTDRKPPAKEAVRPVARPSFGTASLKSGARLIVASMPGSPWVELSIVSTRGPADVSADAHASAHVLEQHMNHTASAKTGRTLLADAEALGGHASARITPEWSRVSVLVPTRFMAEAADVLAAHALRPRFDEAAAADARRRAITAAAATRQSAHEGSFALRVLYGAEHPLSPRLYEESDLRTVDLKKLEELHARLFDRRNLVFVAAGGTTTPSVTPIFEAAASSIPSGKGPLLSPKPSKATPASAAVAVVDVHGRQVIDARVLVHVTAPSAATRAALELTLQHLSLVTKPHGEPTSASLVRLRDHDRFVLSFIGPRDRSLAGLRTAIVEIDRLRTRGLTDSELARARDRARVRVGAKLGNPSAVMASMTAPLSSDAPPAALSELADAIEKVTADDLRRVVSTTLSPAALRVAVEGEFGALHAPLAAIGIGSPVRYTSAGSPAPTVAAAPPASAAPSVAANPAPAAPPPIQSPPPPVYNDVALDHAERFAREEERRRADEERRREREERERQRKMEWEAEDRRLREQAERDRQEADRRFQEQMLRIQQDFQRQLEQQRGQGAAVLARIREQQARARADAERARSDAQRRAQQRERDAQQRRAERDRQVQQQRAAEEQRERARLEAARRNEAARQDRARQDRERQERERQERERQERERLARQQADEQRRKLDQQQRTCTSGQWKAADGSCATCQSANSCLSTTVKSTKDIAYCRTNKAPEGIMATIKNTCSQKILCKVCPEGSSADCRRHVLSPGQTLGGWATDLIWCRKGPRITYVCTNGDSRAESCLDGSGR